MKTTVVVPSYNELRTLPAVLEALCALELEKEILVVDDGSLDGTAQWLGGELAAGRYPPVKLLVHDRNRGKGAALRTGFAAASGDIVLVQDADLEYDPAGIPALVRPIAEGRADAVYGSRLLVPGVRAYSALYLWGNRFLTFLVNLLFGAAMSDSYTCYKAYRTALVKGFALSSDGFEIEAELACKTAFSGCRFLELPVKYASRSRGEGKKIGFPDAVKGTLKILALRLSLRRAAP